MLPGQLVTPLDFVLSPERFAFVADAGYDYVPPYQGPGPDRELRARVQKKIQFFCQPKNLKNHEFDFFASLKKLKNMIFEIFKLAKN